MHQLKAIECQENLKTIDQSLSNARSVYRNVYIAANNAIARIKKGGLSDLNFIEKSVEQVIRSLEKNSEALLSVCLNRSGDDYLLKHAASTAIIAAKFCLYLGMSEEETKEITMGALMCDIGKVLVPSDILYKPGKLSEKEYGVVKNHTLLSQKLLEKYGEFSENTFHAVVEHHERANGSGYPNGLNNDKISLPGRITALADTFDAMVSERSHQTSLEPSKAIAYLISKSGTLFDSNLVKLFAQCIGIYPAGTLVALNNGFIGVVLQQNCGNDAQPLVRLVYDLKQKRTTNHFYDKNLSEEINTSGLKIIKHVDKARFSFNPLSAIG
ncbi:MAG: HD-GYP domain-containing protein [Gammaproteobacteria bacterium]|nr:HD-GYP domain-containing protein [Gammaproteobacteria bacterium]